MKKLLLTMVMVVGVVGSASAQQAPADKYVPFAVDEKTYNDLNAYLGDVPAKWANPLLNTFVKLEQLAQIGARLEKEKEQKAPEHKPTAEVKSLKPTTAKPMVDKK